MKIKIDKKMKIALLKATATGELDTDIIPGLNNILNDPNPFILAALKNGHVKLADIPELNQKIIEGVDPLAVMRTLNGIDE